MRNNEPINQNTTSKLNKAYLRNLDRKFDRLFKNKGKFSTGRLTNTSKSVYSFEGEVLSEEDDEYNSDSSQELPEGNNIKGYNKSRISELENRHN